MSHESIQISAAVEKHVKYLKNNSIVTSPSVLTRARRLFVHTTHLTRLKIAMSCKLREKLAKNWVKCAMMHPGR
jgi:hypothetical protein